MWLNSSSLGAKGAGVADDLASTKVKWVDENAGHKVWTINSQSGVFLLLGEDAVLLEIGLTEIRIKKDRVRNKAGLITHFPRFGINESAMYPWIEKVAGGIANEVSPVKNRLDKSRENVQWSRR